MAVADDAALRKATADLAKAKDPKERLALVRVVMDVQGKRAARLLAKLVRDDPSIDVRVGAARALGLIRAENALDLVIERVLRGGPRDVRAELARAVYRRTGGRDALLGALGKQRTGRLGKGLILRSLWPFDDETTHASLLEHVQGDDDYLRGEALHALVARDGDRGKLVKRLLRLLIESGGVDRVMPVLDAAESVLHPSMRGPLASLQRSKHTPVREAADHLLVALEKLETTAKQGEEEDAVDPEDRYDPGKAGRRTPPRETTPGTHTRPRFDLVFALDATGSTWGTLPEIKDRILREMDMLIHLGSSVRVGIIVYRGGRSETGKAQRFQMLAPTWDPNRVRAFLGRLKSGGVDDRGAPVAQALDDALDRVGWRWAAKRTVRLYADSRIEDPRRALRTVAIHYEADRTKTRVVYVLRTRTKMPPEYEELARRGGTKTPTVMD